MKRWIILIASVILQIILGGIYAWSVFVPGLYQNYNISASKSSLIFGDSFVFLAYGISAILGPALGGSIYDITGTYRLAIYGLFIITLIGSVSVYLMEKGKTN